MDLALETPIEQGLRYEMAAIRAALSWEDYGIGLSAFAQKRKPSFPPLTARRITRRPETTKEVPSPSLKPQGLKNLAPHKAHPFRKPL